jgi:EmrB/QacA subfamily drug resistance transporter
MMGMRSLRVPTGTTRIWVLVLTSLASMMVALDTLVVTTALTTIRADLGASIEQLEWTVNAYNLSFAVLLMTAAILGDRFGRRRMFVAGLAIFVAASAGCALAPDVGWLIVSRAVQGVGAALVMPLALSLLSAAFPPERRATALGVFSGLTGLAVAGGPVVGGAIAEGAAWEWIFWLNVPIGLVVIPLVLGRIEESRGSDTALDLPGLALVSGAAFAVVWGLVRSNAAGWTSAEVLTAFIVGALLAVAFVAWERRATAPMLPLQLFRSRPFSSGNAANFLQYAALFGSVFFMAQFLQTGLGYGPLGAGLRLMPWTATLFFVAPIGGALVGRVGERPIVVGGLLLQAAGLLWIVLIGSADVDYVELIAPLIVTGCGTSLVFPATQNAVLGSVPLSQTGKASGAFSTGRELGGVFGVAIAVALFAGAGGYASAQDFTDGFVVAIGGSAALASLGALAGLWLPSRPRTAPADPKPVEPLVEMAARG